MRREGAVSNSSHDLIVALTIDLPVADLEIAIQMRPQIQ